MQEAEELYDLRESLEAFAVEKAIARLDSNGLEKLQHKIELYGQDISKRLAANASSTTRKYISKSPTSQATKPSRTPSARFSSASFSNARSTRYTMKRGASARTRNICGFWRRSASATFRKQSDAFAFISRTARRTSCLISGNAPKSELSTASKTAPEKHYQTTSERN